MKRLLAVMVMMMPLMTHAADRPQDQKGCEAASGQWGRFEANVEYCQDAAYLKAKAECLNGHGQWVGRGKAQIPGCVMPYSDGGKSCQTNEECLSKECLYVNGKEDHGECKRSDNHFGCFTPFQKNAHGLRGGGCVD